ncbi:hypothetical protein ABIE62_002069 [Porphyrobacter sp. MBR-155]|jgi:hypothetical protein
MQYVRVEHTADGVVWVHAACGDNGNASWPELLGEIRDVFLDLNEIVMSVQLPLQRRGGIFPLVRI